MAGKEQADRSRAALYRFALLSDHGLLRQLWGNNTHWVTPDLVRSGQPLPGHLRRLARHHGLRTVVSLRTPTWESPPLALERGACAELGLALARVKLRSGQAPKRRDLHTLAEMFQRIAYPALIHCKSGIDRTGLAAALYLHLVEGRPIAQTNQLRFWPYFYLPGGPSGILQRFLADYAAHPLAAEGRFLTWVDEVYDPDALKASFRPSPTMTLITRRLLRRE